MSHRADVRDLLSAATDRLTAAGVPSARHDATALLAHVLGRPVSALLGGPAVTADAAARFADLLGARADRVPLQHLTGVVGFRYLDLAVGPGVFVPRPETELLAGWAVERLAGHPAPAVADLCCGCGAIALALAHELPRAAVWAVELDPMAVAWARRNVQARAAAGDRPVELVAGDAADATVLAELDATLDAVVMNPPYVPDGAVVAREVAEHDPPLALWGGPDGLDVVRRLLHRAAALLEPGGVLGIEHADLQGEAMPALVAAHGAFTDVADHRDLNDRPRFTTAVRR